MTELASGTDRASALALRGTITGSDLSQLADALDHLTRASPRTVYVDLARLDGWSLLAQAMVLSTSRAVTRSGGRLVLLNPSPAVRAEGSRLDMFGRVPYGRSDSWPRPEPHLGVAVALLVVARRRLLLTRAPRDPVLRLPGGRLYDGQDSLQVLARHVADLGGRIDEQALEPSSMVRTLTARDGDVEVETLCFEVPAPDLAAPGDDNTKKVWASGRTPGVFDPSASEAVTALQRDGYID